MGTKAIDAAVREGYRLGDKHAARALLYWMARTVLDEPVDGKPALTYWAGFQHAAIGLGKRVVDKDTPEARAALTAVKRAWRDAEQVGLIKQLRAPGYGHAKQWLLTLEPAESAENALPRSGRGRRRSQPGSVTDPRPVESRGSVTDPEEAPEGVDLPVTAPTSPIDGGRSPTGSGLEDRSVQGSVTGEIGARSPTPLLQNTPTNDEEISNARERARKLEEAKGELRELEQQLRRRSA